MPPPSAERVADGLWHRLRPLVIDIIGAALIEPEPADAEASHIAERVARQIHRCRAQGAPPTSRRPKR